MPSDGRLTNDSPGSNGFEIAYLKYGELLQKSKRARLSQTMTKTVGETTCVRPRYRTTY